MGDMAEVFRAMTRYKKAKRASNTEKSTALLNNLGVDFVAHNYGAHLVVRRMSFVVDFWPSTGIWIDRSTKAKKRGVFPLLEHIGFNTSDPTPEPIDAGDPPW